ncbi:MAG: hypothetical protein CAK88_13435 [Verrucomicrobiia bacterium AMD-G2]|nr:MAG: hypothetical protein CAK88_13435 [Verrucomicrobiae bacterium AMD-G2]
MRLAKWPLIYFLYDRKFFLVILPSVKSVGEMTLIQHAIFPFKLISQREFSTKERQNVVLIYSDAMS